jgi:lipopolysaccharide transport system ATP-binding protein
MEKLIKNQNTTVLFVSHSDQSIVQICTRALLINSGHKLLEGEVKGVVQNYKKILFSTNGNLAKVTKEISKINIIREIDSDKSINENNNSNLNKAAKLSPIYKEKEFFSEKLISKSKFINKDGDTKISDIYIRTIEGRKVNHLVCGENYDIVYVVDSEKDNILAYSFTIRNDKGLIYTGFKSDHGNHGGIPFKKGRNEIVLPFLNLFLKGFYYFSASLYDKEGVKIFGISDISVFESTNDANRKSVGVVSLIKCGNY